MPFKTVVRAGTGTCGDRLCTKDVTQVLKSAGLSDAQIALFPTASPFFDANGKRQGAPALTDDQTKRLLSEHLLVDQGPSAERFYPSWLADVTYEWEMAFKGSKTLDVSHEYVPFTSAGSNSYNFTENSLRNDYCADDSLIAAWQKLVQRAAPNPSGFGPVAGRRVE